MPSDDDRVIEDLEEFVSLLEEEGELDKPAAVDGLLAWHACLKTEDIDTENTDTYKTMILVYRMLIDYPVVIWPYLMDPLSLACARAIRDIRNRDDGGTQET